MNRFRRLTIAASLSLALVSVPAMALAADATYAIRGVEYAATPEVGSFAGVAVAADDYGTWQATVVHGALPTTQYASANILTTDGTTTSSFALDGKRRDLAGTFDSGLITLLTPASTCGKQIYSVAGTLTLAAGTGTANFGAVLTHYRIWWSGRCITYAATVKGLVTFHL